MFVVYKWSKKSMKRVLLESLLGKPWNHVWFSILMKSSTQIFVLQKMHLDTLKIKFVTSISSSHYWSLHGSYFNSFTHDSDDSDWWLFLAWWRHQMETFSVLLATCAGNFPHKGQWRGALMGFFVLRPNKRLSKQWWGWWFETSLSPLSYYPLFRVRSWNNGVRCMSFCILMAPL